MNAEMTKLATHPVFQAVLEVYRSAKENPRAVALDYLTKTYPQFEANSNNESLDRLEAFLKAQAEEEASAYDNLFGPPSDAATPHSEAQAQGEFVDPMPLFPAIAKTFPNWVTYGGPKDKAPRISGTTRSAMSNDPTTWVDYATACENIAKGLGCQFLGFVTNGVQSGNLTGFDIDGGKIENGLQPWVIAVLEIIRQIAGLTYIEWTPNGGLRAWVRGDFKKHGRRTKYKMAAEKGWNDKAQVVEVFDDGLYFTTTGSRYSDTSDVAVLDDTQTLALLDGLAKLSIEDPMVDAQKTGGEADPAFADLFAKLGWQPLEDRMNKMDDPRYHELHIDDKLTYCPMPGHGPRDLNVPYTRCFGVVPGADGAVVHCFGCDWSGDMVKTVREFDGSTLSMTDYARALCAEYGLNADELFPSTQLDFNQKPDAGSPAAIQATQQAAAQPMLRGEPRKFNPKTFALMPLFGHRFSGWFPLGRVTLVSGPSGSAKTTFLIQALISARRGDSFLGHDGGRLPFIFLFADRGEHDSEETFERMGVVGQVPYACINHLTGAEATEAAIADVVSKDEFQIVVIDGGDFLVGDNNDAKFVTAFTSMLQRLAKHYGVGFVVTTGSGKQSAKALKEGAERRSMTIGSEKWGRAAGTVFTLNSEDDGTGDKRRLIAQHRNAATERFLLQFQNGQLVSIPEPPKLPTTNKEVGDVAFDQAVRWYKNLFKDGNGGYKKEVTLREHRDAAGTTVLSDRSLRRARNSHNLGIEFVQGRNVYIRTREWDENDVNLELPECPYDENPQASSR